MFSLFRGRACLALLLLVVLASGAGCTQEVFRPARTQILLRIETQSEELRERFTTLRVATRRREGDAWRKGPDAAFGRERIAVWPVELPVLPGEHETAEFEVVVRALDGDQVLAEARAVTMFVRDSRRVLTLRLEPCPGRALGFVCAEPDCHGASCEVCNAAGECVPVGVQPGDDLPEQGADSVMGSAGADDRDGGSVDASRRDAGRDGGDAGSMPVPDGTDATVEPGTEVDASGPTVEPTCDEEGLLRCAAAGSAARQRCEDGAWVDAEPCSDQQICDLQAAEAGACRELLAVCAGSAGKAVCDGELMQFCDEQGDAERTLPCASENHCQRGLAAEACAICLEGERRCEGTSLEVCSDDGQSFRQVETCESAALCNAMTGSCTPGCAPGAKVCEGDALRVCKSDLTGFEDDEQCAKGLCDEAGEQCDVCAPMSKKCDGNSVSTCNAQGQAYTTQACAAPRSVCTGNGVCVECTTAADCPRPESDCVTASCNATNGTCGTTPKPRHASCETGVCNGTGRCVPCVDQTDCRTPGLSWCAATGCVQCTSDSHCGSTEMCQGNRCIAKPDCMDGTVNAGEECDDGNSSNSDGCLNSCKNAFCGDGYVRTSGSPREACDPAAAGESAWTCHPESCTKQTAYTPCAGDADCLGGGICFLSVCSAPCPSTGSATGCPASVPPTSPLCGFGNGLGTPGACIAQGCTRNSDCAPGAACYQSEPGTVGYCSGCGSDADCPAGKRCMKPSGALVGYCI